VATSLVAGACGWAFNEPAAGNSHNALGLDQGLGRISGQSFL